MRFLAFALVIAAALGAFLVSHHRPRAVPLAAAAPAPAGAQKLASTPASTALPASDEEPDEASLERVLRAQYAEIERQGGMPLIVTATGQRIVIHPRLYSLKKTGCRRLGGVGASEWECTASIMGTLRAGDKPLPSGERLTVKRGPTGDWIPA